jgi:hypothetical protein
LARFGRFMIYIALFFFISGCSLGSGGAKNVTRIQVGPLWRQAMFQYGPQGASELFQLGWQDGCESGLAAAGNQLQKLAYNRRFRSDYVEEDRYIHAWQHGLMYCYRYLYQYLQKPFSD